jgi:hypothetical protein
MGYKVPFLVGIRNHEPHFRDQSDCTPPSHNERCGKPFIFNGVSYLGTHLDGQLSEVETTTVDSDLPFWHFHRVRIPEKSSRPRDRSTAARVMLLRIEYSAKVIVRRSGAKLC